MFQHHLHKVVSLLLRVKGFKGHTEEEGGIFLIAECHGCTGVVFLIAKDGVCTFSVWLYGIGCFHHVACIVQGVKPVEASSRLGLGRTDGANTTTTHCLMGSPPIVENFGGKIAVFLFGFT